MAGTLKPGRILGHRKPNSRAGRAINVLGPLFAACTLLLPLSASADDPAAFSWSVTPYLWASETKVDLVFRDTATGGDRISFKDLLDQLDTAVMLNVEFGQGHWSVFADLTYLETSDVEQRPLFLVDSYSETTVLDAGLAWWPNGVGSALSVIAGTRYSGFDSRYRFSRDDQLVREIRDADDYYDLLLGLRYRLDFGRRWSLATHGDYSFGDSEGTWLLRALLTRPVGKREMNRFLVGYQYKRAEFVSGDLRSDYSYHGPVAGFSFRF